MIVIKWLSITFLIGFTLLYLYAVHKIIGLWRAKYNKRQLLFLWFWLIIFVSLMWYTVYMRKYGYFWLLGFVIIYSLIVAYEKTKK